MSFCWIPTDYDDPEWDLISTVAGLKISVWINIQAYHQGDEAYKMAVETPTAAEKVECYYSWQVLVERTRELERLYNV